MLVYPLRQSGTLPQSLNLILNIQIYLGMSANVVETGLVWRKSYEWPEKEDDNQ